jgi:hypothetical protein
MHGVDGFGIKVTLWGAVAAMLPLSAMFVAFE